MQPLMIDVQHLLDVMNFCTFNPSVMHWVVFLGDIRVNPKYFVQTGDLKCENLPVPFDHLIYSRSSLSPPKDLFPLCR